MPYLGVASRASLMNKTQLYYDDRSMSQARTVVFLHDWPLNRQAWEYPVALFSRGYRTITIDLPGFGRSDQPGGLISYESYARDVAALVTVLDLSQIILVGAGMGAGVAVSYALGYARTLAGLVLVGALSPRWTRAPGFPQGVARDTVESLLDKSQTNWPDLLTYYAGSLCHTAVGEPTKRWFVNMGLEASLYAVQQSLIFMRNADQRDDLASINVPTAIFHGVHDAIAPFAIGEYLAENINNAQLTRFEHSGHATWIDEKYRFNTELTGFIEERAFGNVLPPPGVERTPDGGERLPFKAIATRPHRGRPKLEGPTGEIYE
ncbi:MAG TPA: alpha/beta hydrolase [Chloroflexota bacterium]|nr:alpha/beta hydrolase [Chloroflexota bacterium]